MMLFVFISQHFRLLHTANPYSLADRSAANVVTDFSVFDKVFLFILRTSRELPENLNRSGASFDKVDGIPVLGEEPFGEGCFIDHGDFSFLSSFWQHHLGVGHG